MKNLPKFEGERPEEQKFTISGTITEEELQPDSLLSMDDMAVLTVDVQVTKVAFSRNGDGELVRAVTVKALGAKIDDEQTYPATFEPTAADDGEDPSMEWDEVTA